MNSLLTSSLAAGASILYARKLVGDLREEMPDPCPPNHPGSYIHRDRFEFDQEELAELPGGAHYVTAPNQAINFKLTDFPEAVPLVCASGPTFMVKEGEKSFIVHFPGERYADFIIEDHEQAGAEAVWNNVQLTPLIFETEMPVRELSHVSVIAFPTAEAQLGQPLVRDNTVIFTLREAFGETIVDAENTEISEIVVEESIRFFHGENELFSIDPEAFKAHLATVSCSKLELGEHEGAWVDPMQAVLIKSSESELSLFAYGYKKAMAMTKAIKFKYGLPVIPVDQAGFDGDTGTGPWAEEDSIWELELVDRFMMTGDEALSASAFRAAYERFADSEPLVTVGDNYRLVHQYVVFSPVWPEDAPDDVPKTAILDPSWGFAPLTIKKAVDLASLVPLHTSACFAVAFKHVGEGDHYVYYANEATDIIADEFQGHFKGAVSFVPVGWANYSLSSVPLLSSVVEVDGKKYSVAHELANAGSAQDELARDCVKVTTVLLEQQVLRAQYVIDEADVLHIPYEAGAEVVYIYY